MMLTVCGETQPTLAALIFQRDTVWPAKRCDGTSAAMRLNAHALRDRAMHTAQPSRASIIHHKSKASNPFAKTLDPLAYQESPSGTLRYHDSTHVFRSSAKKCENHRYFGSFFWGGAKTMDFSLYQQPSWHVTAARNFTKHIFVNKAFVCDETKKVHSLGTAIFRQNVECQIRRLLSEVLNRRKMCLINVVLWLLRYLPLVFSSSQHFFRLLSTCKSINPFESI
jgi:hypothetical protein